MTTVARTSPRVKARMAGAFWMIAVVASLFDMNVSNRIYVLGNATATSNNIISFEPLYRVGLISDLTALLAFIVVTVLLYELFKPVNRTVSLLAAFFGLAGISIGISNAVFRVAPLAILGGAPYLRVFRQDQLNALSLLSHNLAGTGGNTRMVVFGVYCLLIGWLVVKSTFIPRLLGLLMVIAGFSYLANSAISFLAIMLPYGLSGYLLLGGIGEILLALWLLIIGVNRAKWYGESA